MLKLNLSRKLNLLSLSIIGTYLLNTKIIDPESAVILRFLSDFDLISSGIFATLDTFDDLNDYLRDILPGV